MSLLQSKLIGDTVVRIEAISFVRNNAENLELEEPIVVTQNGKPVYVIESLEERKRREEATTLLKLLSFCVKDEAEGKTLSGDQVLSNIRAKYLDKK